MVYLEFFSKGWIGDYGKSRLCLFYLLWERGSYGDGWLFLLV